MRYVIHKAYEPVVKVHSASLNVQLFGCFETIAVVDSTDHGIAMLLDNI